MINAGSAVRATWSELRACGAGVRVLGALAVLGSNAARLGLPLETTRAIDNNHWLPAECPMCALAVPLDDLTPARSTG